MFHAAQELYARKTIQAKRICEVARSGNRSGKVSRRKDVAMAKMFILYDGRARMSGETDDAAVLDTADSEKEARSRRGDWPEDSIWCEYDIDADRKTLINEQFRFDIRC